jgi:membrane-bound ClpP family serine protease
MRITLLVVGAVLALLGVIWFLQGVNILPGSFMTGQTKWAVYGTIAFAAGVAMLFFARRLGKKTMKIKRPRAKRCRPDS